LLNQRVQQRLSAAAFGLASALRPASESDSLPPDVATNPAAWRISGQA